MKYLSNAFRRYQWLRSLTSLRRRPCLRHMTPQMTNLGPQVTPPPPKGVIGTSLTASPGLRLGGKCRLTAPREAILQPTTDTSRDTSYVHCKMGLAYVLSQPDSLSLIVGSRRQKKQSVCCCSRSCTAKKIASNFAQA